MQPGSRRRYWLPRTGKYAIFMAGASLERYYMRVKGFQMEPPARETWWWYYNPAMLYSVSPNAVMDRAQAIDGPFPTGPIQSQFRLTKTDDTWEEFYKRSRYEKYEQFNDDNVILGPNDQELDAIIAALRRRGLGIVPLGDEVVTDTEHLTVAEEESTGDGDSDESTPPSRDGDVSEQGGATHGSFADAQ